MKFIHCADLHLCAPHTSLPSKKANMRKLELLHTFERLCEYALANGVTAVILAGDTFDVHKVTKKIKDSFIGCIKKCANVDFLYLPGNHDDSAVFENVQDLPSNLKFFKNEWTSYKYDNVNVQGVYFDGNNSKNVYSTFSAEKDQINIAVMHGQIAGYKSEETAEVISLPSLKNKHIDYLALGHYHTFTTGTIDDRGVYAYSGCLEGRGFDELGDKGFVLLETIDKKIKVDFVKFASRKLVEYEFVIDGNVDWFENREKLLKELNLIDNSSLVKVVLKGSHPLEYNVDKNQLALKLNQTFFFAKVYDKTSINIELSAYADDKSVKGEFIRLVMTSDLDVQLKSKIILCGINALDGEELL